MYARCHKSRICLLKLQNNQNKGFISTAPLPLLKLPLDLMLVYFSKHERWSKCGIKATLPQLFFTKCTFLWGCNYYSPLLWTCYSRGCFSCQLSLYRNVKRALQSLNSHNTEPVPPDSHTLHYLPVPKHPFLPLYHRSCALLEQSGTFHCWQNIDSGTEGISILVHWASILLKVAWRRTKSFKTHEPFW